MKYHIERAIYLINHILFFLFLIVIPTYVFFNTKKIKESSDPFIKEKTYHKIFVIYWASAISFSLFSTLPNVYFIQNPVHLGIIWIVIVCLVGFYLLISQVLPVILLTFSDKLRKMTTASFDKKSYIFPTTDRQRALFWIVPVTVGICEEIIFRGYLYQYFQTSPYGLNALLSFLLVSVIFGLGHFQQGLSGIVLTTLLGFLLGYFYFLTGSLLLSIIIHIVFDAKILFISSTLQKHKIKENIESTY